MKKSFIITVFGTVLCSLTWGITEESASSEGKDGVGTDVCYSVQNESPVLLGDPFILNDNGTYYLYGTSVKNGTEADGSFEVFRSIDLHNWTGPCGATNGFALHKDDVWGNKRFWAPEVYKINGMYYMFFSVELHIAVATSTSPVGPFVQEKEGTYITERKAIDNHLFVDCGKPYIYYVSFEPNGLEVFCAELSDDLMTIKEGTEVKCISRNQAWESVEKGSVNEGPFVLKNEDYYYMVYSGNGFTSQDYGLGFAVSKSPKGPWVKYPGNPILQKPGSLVGVGHCSLFKDADQSLKVVYHSHFDDENVHPRRVHVCDVSFVKEEGYDYKVMKIDSRKINSLVLSDN